MGILYEEYTRESCTCVKCAVVPKHMQLMISRAMALVTLKASAFYDVAAQIKLLDATFTYVEPTHSSISSISVLPDWFFRKGGTNPPTFEFSGSNRTE